MTTNRISKVHIALFGAILVMASNSAFAQALKIQGAIISRAGNTMTLKTSDGTSAVVVLNDNTDVQQVEGAFKARKKDMSMAALIPGLMCQVQGTYNAQNQLVAQWVRFTGEDLQQAQSAQAAVHETKVAAAANQAELQQQADALAAQNAALKEQQAAITAQQKEIAANKAKIAANSARFGELDDYYILDEVTVYLCQRPGQGGPEIQRAVAGTRAEGDDVQRIQHPGEGLCLFRGQRSLEPET